MSTAAPTSAPIGGGQPVKDGVAIFRRPLPPTFNSVEEEQNFQVGHLAAGYRLCHYEKLEAGSTTYVSYRDAIKKDALWIKPVGIANAAVRKSDLLCVDFDGNVLKASGREGYGYDEETVCLHIGIYKARPDINGIAQANTPFARDFSVMGKNVDMILQDSCSYYKKVNVLPLEESTITSPSFDPDSAAKRLGEGKALIMLQRGLLTVGNTIDSALAWFVRLNNLCYIQCLADAAAKARGQETVKINEDALEFTLKNVSSEHHAWVHTQPVFDIIESDPNSDHLL